MAIDKSTNQMFDTANPVVAFAGYRITSKIGKVPDPSQER